MLAGMLINGTTGLRRRSLVALLGFAACAALIGVSASCDGKNCDLVGCRSGVSFVLPAPPEGTADIELCANDTCEKNSFNGALKIEPKDLGRLTSASVRFLANDGRVLLEGRWSGDLVPARQQPNGEGCGPVCRIARFRLTPSGELTVERLPSRA